MSPIRPIASPAQRGFSLLEVIFAVAVFGIFTSVVYAFLGQSKAKAQNTQREAVARLLNDAETRSVLENVGGARVDKESAFTSYVNSGLVNGISEDIISGLGYSGGRWTAEGTVDPAAVSSGADSGGTFDLDGGFLWDEYSSAASQGGGRTWIEDASGAELEAIFVFLEGEQERTDFVHAAAGAPAARMFSAAWSSAVEKLIAEAYTNPEFARSTYESISGAGAGRFYSWLRDEARW
jgi:prepilin-type N-terminal cleavage/methylation domain-containing protein